MRGTHKKKKKISIVQVCLAIEALKHLDNTTVCVCVCVRVCSLIIVTFALQGLGRVVEIFAVWFRFDTRRAGGTEERRNKSVNTTASHQDGLRGGM